MGRKRSSPRPTGDSKRSLLSLGVLIVGAAASLATTPSESAIDEEASARVRLSATEPVAVWRMDFSATENAVLRDGLSTGGTVVVSAGGEAARGFEAGMLALYVVRDPGSTDPVSSSATAADEIATHLDCQPYSGCSRTMYVVVESRDAGSAESSVDLRAYATIRYTGKAAPDGAEMDVSLTEVDEFATTTARTDTQVIPPSKKRRPLPREYRVSVTTSAEAGLGAPNVIGYVSAWGDSRSHGRIDLSQSGTYGDVGAGFDVHRFDHSALEGGACVAAAECTVGYELLIDSPRKVTWWTESRLIFLDQTSPPVGATVSMVVDEV